MSDPQRMRVYESEHQLQQMLGGEVREVRLHGTRVTLPPELRFGSIEAVQTYCDKVCLECGEPPVNVVGPAPGKKNVSKAYYTSYKQQIYIPLAQFARNEWAAREVVVLHELAHHVARGVAEAHGPEFCAVYLDLLERHMSPEVAWVLRSLYAGNAVRVAAPVVQ